MKPRLYNVMVELENGNYRATLLGVSGGWKKTAREAMADMLVLVDPLDVADAIGIAPVYDGNTRICMCGLPMGPEDWACERNCEGMR
jgi:hypothetical protein